MIVVAEAGGTKTQWMCCKVSDPTSKIIIETKGINISVFSDETIAEVIRDFSNKLCDQHKALSSCSLFFFGAGCNNDKAKKRLQFLFSHNFPLEIIRQEYHSDIEGAARALFGDKKGLVCILGTGSASGIYNGKTLVDSVPSLGFILGDEGSGAFMGKILLNRLYKRELSSKIKVKLEEFASIDISDVIENVYRKQGANRYLASFMPFIKSNENEEEIDELIDFSLKLFFIKNVLKYKNKPNNKLGFVGSVAFLFSDRLRGLSEEYGFEIEKFIQNPITELMEYYLKKYIIA